MIVLIMLCVKDTCPTGVTPNWSIPVQLYGSITGVSVPPQAAIYFIVRDIFNFTLLGRALDRCCDRTFTT